MTDYDAPELPLRVPHRSLIDGEWTALDGATFVVTDKADDSELAHLPDATPEDVDAVMEGAWEGFLAWSRPRRGSGRTRCAARTSSSRSGPRSSPA